MNAASLQLDAIARVTSEATLENLKDLWRAERELRSPDDIRRVDVSDALVDTGATLLSLPTRLIRELGLGQVCKTYSSNYFGSGKGDMYDPVRLTIQGRSCTMDVMEVPDNVPVLIGRLAIQHLDFVVDLRGRRLIGNPAHGGEHTYEL